MPRWIFWVIALLVAVSWIPFAFIAKARVTKHAHTRFQVFPDMDKQPVFRAQSANPLFADTRAARPSVPGTIARDAPSSEEPSHTGKENGEWVAMIPLEVTDGLMRRGRERYDIHCAPCHGLAGMGDGIVSHRAEALQEGTWVLPSSLHDVTVRERPAGHLYNTITNGIRNMPAYGSQMEEADRWAIVAYVRALQRSQNARIEDVPAEMRPHLR